MGRSLPRQCKSCKSTVKGDFAKHVKSCRKKMPFTGWKFFNADGAIVSEEQLPVRTNRVTDGKKGKDVAGRAPKTKDEDA